MASPQKKKPQESKPMSGVERLTLRISNMINHPIAQDRKWATIHRLDTDGDREWEEVMGALADVDSIEMTFNDDVVDGHQAVVRTTLLIGNGSGMSLDYWMHHPRDRWQVYDLSVNGISLVASYRSQFNKIVRTESYEALVARLKSRQVGFAAPAAGQPGGQLAR